MSVRISFSLEFRKIRKLIKIISNYVIEMVIERVYFFCVFCFLFFTRPRDPRLRDFPLFELEPGSRRNPCLESLRDRFRSLRDSALVLSSAGGLG